MKKSHGENVFRHLEPLLRDPAAARKWVIETPLLSGGSRQILLVLIENGLLTRE